MYVLSACLECFHGFRTLARHEHDTMFVHAILLFRNVRTCAAVWSCTVFWNIISRSRAISSLLGQRLEISRPTVLTLRVASSFSTTRVSYVS